MGILVETIFLFVTYYEFCLESLLWYESLLVFLFYFKSWILAGHTYLREPKLLYDFVGFRVPADPWGSNTGVRAEILPSTYLLLAASLGSKLRKEQHKTQSYKILHLYILVRSVCQGLLIGPHTMARKVRTLSTVRHPKLIALYASAPNHVLGQ